MKTSELTGLYLDWAVATLEVEHPIEGFDYFFMKNHGNGFGLYSASWEQGGPIIEREDIDIMKVGIHQWRADCGPTRYGPTPLIAAMRCYVASKLGDEIEIPEELK